MSYTVTNDPDKRRDGSDYFRVSPLAYARLLCVHTMLAYSYSIVYIENVGVNLFAVRNDLLDYGREYPVPLDRFWFNHQSLHTVNQWDALEWVHVPRSFDPTQPDWEVQLQRHRLRAKVVSSVVWRTGESDDHRPSDGEALLEAHSRSDDRLVDLSGSGEHDRYVYRLLRD
ncbi:hypothetical protein FOA52_014609 [Chlamydomonas sp. UWO 241]|nr:hypothetical protein FOA52_014609 [Chlamydomonas sp. UWO 241]